MLKSTVASSMSINAKQDMGPSEYRYRRRENRIRDYGENANSMRLEKGSLSAGSGLASGCLDPVLTWVSPQDQTFLSVASELQSGNWRSPS